MDVLRDIWKDNPWVPPFFAAAGIAGTFVFAGLVAGVVGTFVLLLVVIGALLNSLRRSTGPTAVSERPALVEDTAVDVPNRDPGQSAETDADVEGQAKPSLAPAAGGADGVESRDEGSDDEHLIEQMLQAAQVPDVNAVRDHGELWISSGKDPDERAGRRGLVFYLASQAGDDHAVAELRTLANEHPANSRLVGLLATVLGDLGEPVTAAEELASRIPNLPEDAAPALKLQEARLRRQADQADEAVQIADAISAASGENPVLRAEALEERGWALEALGRAGEAFGDFERALSISPDNYSLRFHLAYSYMDAGLNDLAIVHFEIAARAARETSASLNNLGVVLQRRGMTVLASKKYAAAADEGSTLAMANIANIAIDSGLWRDAENWIERARTAELVHRNVEAAAARLAEKANQESERLKDLRDRARGARLEIAAFADNEPSVLPEGSWTFSTGWHIQLSRTDSGSGGETGGGVSYARVDLEPDHSLLRFSASVGQVTQRSIVGLATCDGSTLHGYLHDWPNAGETSALLGKSVEATDAES